LRGGPRGFRPGFPCPAVLRNLSREAVRFRLRDCYPLWCDFPFASANARLCNSPTRRQTDQDRPYNTHATTAAAYHVAWVWDVSVHRLATTRPMYSSGSTRALPRVGFPIRRSRGQRLVSTSPGLIAAAHVLHRLSAPRHPPCALVLLIEKNTFHHYGVFKVRAARSDSH
jgi:hypothetical protein